MVTTGGSTNTSRVAGASVGGVLTESETPRQMAVEGRSIAASASASNSRSAQAHHRSVETAAHGTRPSGHRLGKGAVH